MHRRFFDLNQFRSGGVYMKKLLAFLLLALFVSDIWASGARVISMGRSDRLYMDDNSIYTNPANVGIYPNMVIGSIGQYKYDSNLDTPYDTIFTYDANGILTSKQAVPSDRAANRDPVNPYFGGIVSFSLDRSSEKVEQYPMLSIGAILNRKDPMLSYLDKNSSIFFGDEDLTKVGSKNVIYIEPVGKADIMAGLALKNGTMLGIGAYLALNKQENLEVSTDIKETKLVKTTLGVNIPASKTIDVEASVNIGVMSLVGKQDTLRDESSFLYPQEIITVADNDVFVKADIRAFSGLSSVNGDFVPHIGFQTITSKSGEDVILGFNGGLGLNLYIDRGFFWVGAEGEYQDVSHKDSLLVDVKDISGKIFFGIERNVLWDWFVLRAGGSKKLIYRKTSDDIIAKTKGQTIWRENPESDASDDDHLGVGIGVNVENRLKIDLVVAEDVFYTFSNLLSGNKLHHMFTRVDASFSF